jgi:hypothetical protein
VVLVEELDLKRAVLWVDLRLESLLEAEDSHCLRRQWNVCASRDAAGVLVLLKAFWHVVVKG